MSATTTETERAFQNVGLPTELHRGLKMEAAREGVTLKALITPVLELLLDPEYSPVVWGLVDAKKAVAEKLVHADT